MSTAQVRTDTYRSSHGSSPKPNEVGNWIFCPENGHIGDLKSFNGTFANAVQQLRDTGAIGTWFLLP